jgi:hypothetical protein
MPNEGWPARLNETIRPLLAQLSSEDLHTTEENGRELDLWETAVSLLDELTELDVDDKS